MKKFILKKKPVKRVKPLKKKVVWSDPQWRVKARNCEKFLMELLAKGEYTITLDGEEPSLSSLSKRFGIKRQEIRHIILKSMSNKELIWINTLKESAKPNTFRVRRPEKRREVQVKKFMPYGGILPA